jgi:hypothetical protein
MNKTTWTVIVVVIVAAAGLWFWLGYQPGQGVPMDSTTGGANPTGTVSAAFDHSISDGTVTVSYASADFGLATNQQQILATAVIPPCDGDFNYCLYYNNTSTYAGTNFESAGIRIDKRADLTTERLCLTTPPAGFDAATQPVASSSADAYSTGVFSVGGGAAGSIANGSLYRLYNRSDNTCYEFETRIAESQFANYPAGAIQEFTADDQAALSAEIRTILNSITLPSGATVSFPAGR